MTETRYFVFGSFSQGFHHFERIQNLIKDTQSAMILGTAYRLPIGFPVVLEDGQDAIHGEVITVQSSDLLHQLLDQFHDYQIDSPEKGSSLKKMVNAFTLDGGMVSCFNYYINPKKLPKNAQLIPGGQWKQSLQERPSLLAVLTQQQRSFILKLGQIKGREVLPIDLRLYRELMNLELIVDKGRRLALSKLGHEAYRHLTEWKINP